MSDEVDFVPDASLSALEPPSTSSIENAFRLAQVVQRRKDPLAAVPRYLIVCDMVQNVIQMNPAARVDVKWVLLSLSSIADIYDGREDWEKSKAFRDCVQRFALYIQSEGKSLDDEDSESTDLDSIASVAVAYGRLFEDLQAARALPDRAPPETPAALLRRIADAHERTQRGQLEAIARRLGSAHDEHEQAIRGSFWRRNTDRIARHPCLAVLILLALVLIILVYATLRPRKPKAAPAPADLSVLEEYARHYSPRPASRTPRPSRTPQYDPPLDDRLFNL
jgi:hypothetical protein